MFRTPLTEDEESKFKLWVFLNKVPFQDEPTADYDMRGYWKALMRGDPLAVQAGNGHFPDIWKTPFHKTFSNESMYALPGAPRWQGNQLVTKDGQVLRDEAPRLKPPLLSNLLGHADLKQQEGKLAVQPSELVTNRPTEWVPDVFPKAQQATIKGEDLMPNFAGMYHQTDNKVGISPGMQNHPGVVAHELGHAIYMNDLSDTDKKAWERLHNQHPNLLGVQLFKDDPSHSFAEVWNEYVTRPEFLKANAPLIYDFLMRRSGFEYKRNVR